MRNTLMYANCYTVIAKMVFALLSGRSLQTQSAH